MAHGHEGEPGVDLGYNSGYARLEHDVVTLPADQQALGLVEAISEVTDVRTIDTTQNPSLTATELIVRLGTIDGLAVRLRVLLEKGNEAEAAAGRFLLECHDRLVPPDSMAEADDSERAAYFTSLASARAIFEAAS